MPVFGTPLWITFSVFLTHSVWVATAFDCISRADFPQLVYGLCNERKKKTVAMGAQNAM